MLHYQNRGFSINRNLEIIPETIRHPNRNKQAGFSRHNIPHFGFGA
jgi:hypothetical protein